MKKSSNFTQNQIAAIPGFFRQKWLLPGFLFVSGCTPLHTNLMTNEQLVQASCQDLAVEHQKLLDNVKAAEESAGVGLFGTLMIAMAELEAGTDLSASTSYAEMNQAEIAAGQEHEERANLINTLRIRKNCF